MNAKKSTLWFIGLTCIAGAIAIEHGAVAGLKFLGISILVSVALYTLMEMIFG